MGNDGGSIPDRRDLVRNKPKAEQADKANQTRARWFFCALSKRLLQEPIVSCALGKLYNKDALLEYLLDKSAYGDGDIICGHIRSLKDVKTVKLTPNSAPSSAKVDATERPQFVCPLTLREMNGVQPFVYISSCGCVFSQAGLKTLTAGSSSSPSPPADGDEASSEKPKQLDVCPQCAQKFDSKTDVLTLNPGPEEEERMREAMERRRLLEPPKKSKKRKAVAAEGTDAEPPSKKRSTPVNNPSISAASKAVVSSLAMEEAKRKAQMSDAVKELYGSNAPKRKETFMTMGTFTRYA
ncbi:hypothetical protein HGRIS_007349 [Hohenbuehelia grisea]|uniref:Replication termination factor 2 n=1 Tax=Hohenbuehelia grisea TaxID=104357 RepID=A0ABR3J4H9_9AGAR